MEYKYLEHTADLKFQAFGNNLNQAFENAAKAMFNAMVPIKQIAPKIEKTINITAESEESLLFDWLSELLRLHDTNDLLFSKFKVNINKLQLKAKIKGEKLNKNKHEPELMIKAMTYNELKIEKGKKNKITIVMDI